jgi:glycine cleavage system regulatory protein
MATLVLTVIGDDQAGLVDALSGVIADSGGNWQRSHMARLAGKFAGIVEVRVADGSARALLAGLEPLKAQGLLHITATTATDETTAAQRTVNIEIMGVDRVGIVHEVAATLAANGINIVEIETETEPAPMAGGDLFRAELHVEVGTDWTATRIASELDAVADELGIDITVAEPD